MSDDGYDVDGFDKDGYDLAGYDSEGYDKSGYDSKGKRKADNIIEKEKEKEFTDNCISQTFEQVAETGFNDDKD